MSIIGQSIYHLYHKPAGHLKNCLRQGGPWEQWKTERGRQAMEQAADALPPLPPAKADSPHLYFITGNRFWYQTLFCLRSWYDSGGTQIAPVLCDDGTLEDWQIQILRDFQSGLTVDTENLVTERVCQALPPDKYPILHERRTHYPHIKKLIDIHAGSTGWKLVMDSDILFFREPVVLIDWLQHPLMPIYALDCKESYGYPRATMEKLCGHTLPTELNVGICGLNSQDIDWEKLEFWCRCLIESHGPHYYLEQAIVAMLCAGKTCTLAPAADYITGPQEAEATQCQAVMHHYVADSKKWYFRKNWRRFCTQGGA